MKKIIPALIIFLFSLSVFSIQADEYLPRDNSFIDYHTSPRYRPSEEHPLRLFAYVFHPIGWVMREAITRPVSALMASTETTRSIFGFREPGDYRINECFTSSLAVPDCRTFAPYNYADETGYGMVDQGAVGNANNESSYNPQRQVYFPNVNFDFNSRSLNALGQAKVNQVAAMLNDEGGITVVLEGHTDSVGTDDYNNTLGLDRAETVRTALVGLGISADSLSTVTFGKTRPVVDEDSGWARALNRRVEVHPGS